MLLKSKLIPALGLLSISTYAQNASSSIGLNWYPPIASEINNLSTVINGTGVYGFIFNSSVTPGSYETYNWCNMPRVRQQEYIRADEEWELAYVEVIHRHHKRTPYAANTFPVESYPWYCNDEGLFFYGEPLNPMDNNSAATYWSVYTNPSNPFPPQGFNGTCQLPQITRGGLTDSYQHGLDLLSVYRDLLHFLPANLSTSNSSPFTIRVTNNVITSQVAGMLVSAILGPLSSSSPSPLLIQPSSIDSLEPTYTCPSATSLYASYGPGSSSPAWLAHLTDSAPLFSTLDSISGVPPTDSAFHISFDHYFDNLSSRLCDAKPLPCQLINGQNSSSAPCITPADADAVFRLGEYEYDFIYRSAGPQTLTAAVASYGVYVAELAQNIRDATALTANSPNPPVKFRHNVAHDGSLSMLLSILQVETMVWPGMGAEVVFELYRSTATSSTTATGTDYAVRILWGGQVLNSSNPTLGVADMVPVERLLGYFDGLVGVGAEKVPGLCGM